MLLQSENRLPIVEQPSSIIPSAFGLSASLSARPMLNVKLVKQEQTQWCWAACTQMVTEFMDVNTPKQCELANFLHGQTGCCATPGSSACNRPAPYVDIAYVFTFVRIHCISERFAIPAATILSELQANRPVEMGLLWSGGGGHVAIIYGVTPEGLVAVHDPWYGSGLWKLNYLYAAYNKGKWTYSYGDFRKV